MKKSTRVITFLLIVSVATLIGFIPTIQKGMRISSYQKQLQTYQAERNHCEQIQLTNHIEADKVRDLLNKELGLTSETQAPQKTGTLAPVITGSIIE